MIKYLKLFLLIFLLAQSSFAIAAPQTKSKTLKMQVVVSKDFPKKKDLLELAGNMEQTAKIYKTTNQRAYWENEGKRSFQKFMRSEGYYASTIDVEIPDEEENILIFHITPWQRYSINKISMEIAKGSNADINLPELDKVIKAKQGKSVIAEDIIESQKAILDYVENNNCLLNLSVSHEATINHLDDNVDIKFIIESGPAATVKNVEFKGLKRVKAEYVRKLVRLKDGQCFRNSYINKSRGYLQKSGLFASTKPTIPKVTESDGSVPVIFNLTERKARSVKAGASFSTDLGLGATFGWEHRNYFGEGEEVNATISGNQKEQEAELEYVEHFYRRDDQTLRLGTKVENTDGKAFSSRQAGIYGFIERELTDTLMAGVGARVSRSKVKDKVEDRTKNFFLLSTPIFVEKDTRNNILDPSKGYVARFEGAPFFSLNSESDEFFKSKISGSTYFKMPVKRKTIIAVRAAVGNIVGVKTTEVPNTERFYAGGSNSVRGYAHQFASDVNEEGRPIGGRSVVETSVELRVNVRENIGLVTFLDAGYAYTNLTPRFDSKILKGAGVGFRYITDFGPIRFDVGFPLNRRKFVDDSWQIYFGLGQAF